MPRVIALIAASGLALSACGGSSSSSSPSKTTASSSGGTTAKAGGTTAVVLNDYFFQPKTISGKPGSTAKLALKNEGTKEHTFTIDSQKVNTTLPVGKSATISVKIPTSGSVQFYCQFHKALGMTGTLKAS